MFAGPNGSGKSTIYHSIKTKYDLGIYLNADDLEQELKQNGNIELSRFGFQGIEPSELDNFINSHALAHKALKEDYKINFSLADNKIVNPVKESNSYAAALLIDFIKQKLINEAKKISFETVMSHPSKIETLKKSRSLGYKNYLYFIGTDSEKINLDRVALRVKRGGHNVAPEKVVSRYYNSLKLLKSAVDISYRSFIFDNSGVKPILILEVFEGDEITYHNEEIPAWVDKYLIY
jgi:predicted ABC-type ATPase